MGLSVTAEGIQMDTVTSFDPSKLSELQRMSFDMWIEEPQTAAIAPQDTLVYFSGSGLNLLWSMVRELMVAEMSQADFDESMSLFAQQFGINPDSDLFPYLDGEVAVIVGSGNGGFIAETSQLNLNMTLLVGTSDQATLATNVDAFSTAVGDPQMGMGVVEKSEADGLTLYELFTPMVEGSSLVYGTGHDYLLISSGRDNVAALQFGGEGLSLQDSRDFQTVQAAFANERTPAMYVNVRGLLEAIRSSVPSEEVASFDEETAVFQPIRYLAATNMISANMAKGTMILFIETE